MDLKKKESYTQQNSMYRKSAVQKKKYPNMNGQKKGQNTEQLLHSRHFCNIRLKCCFKKMNEIYSFSARTRPTFKVALRLDKEMAMSCVAP